MRNIQKKQLTALQSLIDECYLSAKQSFEKTYEIFVSDSDNPEMWIAECERNKWTDHPFYQVLLAMSLAEDIGYELWSREIPDHSVIPN